MGGYFFIVRSQQTEEPDLSELQIERAEIGKSITEPQVLLVLSPEMLDRASTPLEGEPGKEPEQYQAVAREIYRLITDTLGIPEQIPGQAQVLEAEYADSDISIEFDCQPNPGHHISQVMREAAAKRVEHFLNTHHLTQSGSAEIWIRQGLPQSLAITSEL